MTKIDLLAAQAEYKQLERPASRLYQNMQCPKRCGGRAINKGNCTVDNCIKLHRDKVAVAAVEKASKLQPRKIVRKLNGRDKAILREVRTFGITPMVDRSVIKQQLKEQGIKIPRLINADKKKLAEINSCRAKLGLAPLADLSHLITGKPRVAEDDWYKQYQKDMMVLF